MGTPFILILIGGAESSKRMPMPPFWFWGGKKVPTKILILKCTDWVFLQYSIGKYQENTDQYWLKIMNLYTTLMNMLSQVHIGGHPYTVTPKSGSLVEWNGAIASWLRLISTSDHYIIDPYWTYTKSLSHWYAVTRPYVCTLISPLAKLAPDLGIQVHLWSDHDVIRSCLKLVFTSDHFMHPY